MNNPNNARREFYEWVYFLPLLHFHKNQIVILWKRKISSTNGLSWKKKLRCRREIPRSQDRWRRRTRTTVLRHLQDQRGSWAAEKGNKISIILRKSCLRQLLRYLHLTNAEKFYLKNLWRLSKGTVASDWISLFEIGEPSADALGSMTVAS